MCPFLLHERRVPAQPHFRSCTPFESKRRRHMSSSSYSLSSLPKKPQQLTSRFCEHFPYLETIRRSAESERSVSVAAFGKRRKAKAASQKTGRQTSFRRRRRLAFARSFLVIGTYNPARGIRRISLIGRNAKSAASRGCEAFLTMEDEQPHHSPSSSCRDNIDFISKYLLRNKARNAKIMLFSDRFLIGTAGLGAIDPHYDSEGKISPIRYHYLSAAEVRPCP